MMNVKGNKHGHEIRIGREKCVGAGTCVTATPSVFDQTEDGTVKLLKREASERRTA